MALQQIPEPAAGSLQPKYQKFTSSGTFTLPTGYGVSKPLLVSIQVIGGGGGGGGEFTTTNNGVTVGNYTQNNYYGGTSGSFTAPTVNYTPTNVNSNGGGSGGIAQTQMYLTSNLTITVGAAGARSNSTYAWTANNGLLTNGYRFAIDIVNITYTGGTGGMSTAGAVSATGGVGGVTNVTYGAAQVNGQTSGARDMTVRSNNSTAGSAGSPAGSAGDAVPLLGALAGGSGNATPVYGAFGIGGKKTDAGTHTGVEGTGGGFGSIGASGAVILTWWE